MPDISFHKSCSLIQFSEIDEIYLNKYADEELSRRSAATYKRDYQHTPIPDLLELSRAMLASEMLKGGLEEISAIKELKPHFSIPRDMALNYAASQGWEIGTKLGFTELRSTPASSTWLQRVIGGIDPQLVLFKVTSLLGDSIPG